jgi:hypothetical protein
MVGALTAPARSQQVGAGGVYGTRMLVKTAL